MPKSQIIFGEIVLPVKMCFGKKKMLLGTAMKVCMATSLLFFNLCSKCLQSLQLHFACVLMAIPLLSPLYQNMNTACWVSYLMN